MFSGIIAGVGEVEGLKASTTGLALEIGLATKLADNLQTGASISVNGVCLTVVSIELVSDISCRLKFDLVNETLACSNFLKLQLGQSVNIERSVKFGDEIGGHLCSGHVDGLAKITAIKTVGQGAEISLEVEAKLQRFIFEKGFVALNGASLTVSKKLEHGFQVSLIPETLARTTMADLKVGSTLNLEIDRSTQAIVETVERVLGR